MIEFRGELISLGNVKAELAQEIEVAPQDSAGASMGLKFGKREWAEGVDNR